MQCKQCGMRPATLHYTKIINGEKTETHLCEVCAEERGEQIPGLESGFSIHNLMSGLLNLDLGTSEQAGVIKSETTLRCPTCGLTYRQFSKIGRFGCSHCYETFGEMLPSVFRRIHGHTTHRGKVPERAGGKLKVRRQMEQLKREMEEAVRGEAFEKAAQIRDQIRTLQQQLDE
ncbi:UvrB/UvrC motif-containing protein [Mechercharimyces sp. CAU 1602]|uniref:UvrB/UvrC motif-containing protein n=1 Tax=Mechercharimyces sp. CAU 1602 TaxID=2973933 RepID=UPI002161B259|nr:UvrB/UvrC motif-containing protein [Mechercharimyces sp. CAU 1602]MCS1352482.1 UvrB/UvrC motif-containing protein [Mechercharimyces sp. CAU 1602]